MFTGIQKAAMLLMNLDDVTATGLLRGLEAEEIQDIAMELARINASEQCDDREQAKVVHEFYSSLQGKQAHKFNMKAFLNEMLVNILDKYKAEQIQTKVKKAS